MTAETKELATTNERLARLEATAEALVRDVGDLRTTERTHFFWILGILLGIFLPLIVGLLVSLITLILKL